MSRNKVIGLACPDCSCELSACNCYDDLDDRIRCRARNLIDDACETEDGQAMTIDPSVWRDLRDALDLYERASGVETKRAAAEPEAKLTSKCSRCGVFGPIACAPCRECVVCHACVVHP